MFCLVIAASDTCEKCPTDFDNFDSCSYHDRLILPYGECGIELQGIEEAASQPNVTFNNAENSSKYVLLMVDPDAPSRQNPSKKFWRHWLVIDLPGHVLRGGDIGAQGNHLTSYYGPNPPAGSGQHRYQFLLFEQPETFSSSSLSIPEARNNFDVTNFVSEHCLCHHLKAAYEYKAFRLQQQR